MEKILDWAVYHTLEGLVALVQIITLFFLLLFSPLWLPLALLGKLAEKHGFIDSSREANYQRYMKRD